MKRSGAVGKKMIKKILIAFLIFVIAVVIYLTVPLPFTLFSTSQKDEFSREEPISLIPDKQNNGERCKEKTVYSSQKNGYTEIGEQILDPRCAKLQEDLNKAVGNGDIESAKNLLTKGANVNTPNNDYDLQYPIVTAINSRNIQIIKLLLDNGADVNHQSCCCASCQRVLDIAIKNNDLEITRLLLKRGANINLKPVYPDEISSLTYAAYYGNFQMAQLIEEEGCKNSIQCRAEFRAKRLWYFIKTIFVKEK